MRPPRTKPCWPQWGSACPAPEWPTRPGLGLLSRTRGLSTGTPQSIALGHHRQECKRPMCRHRHLTASDTSRVCGRNWRWPPRFTGHSCLGLQLPPTWEGAARPVPGSPVRPQLNCVLFKSLPRDESWASGGGGSRPPVWTPGAGGRLGGHPPGRLQGDIRQGQPVFPQAGVPGSSVGTPSDENVTGSSTLDPSLLTDPKLGLFLILMTFMGEKAARHSYVIPSHSEDLGRAWASHEAA